MSDKRCKGLGYFGHFQKPKRNGFCNVKKFVKFRPTEITNWKWKNTHHGNWKSWEGIGDIEDERGN